MQALPLPARLVPWPKAPPTTVMRCVLLAALLHVWLVLVLGNAPGGTARQGQGVWGAVNVTLRGPVSEGAVNVVMPPTAAKAAAGVAAAPRWGGAVRQAEALPDSEPGAARLGAPAPQVSATPAGRAEPVPQPQPQATSDSPPPALRTLPALARPLVQEPMATPPALLLPAPLHAVSLPAAPPLPPALPPPPVPAAPPLPPPLTPLQPAPPQPAVAEGRLAAAGAREALVPQPPLLPTASTLPPLPPSAALPTVPTPSAIVAAPRPEPQLESPLLRASGAPSAAAPLPHVPESMPLPRLASPASPADAPTPLRRLQAAPTAPRAAEPALPGRAELPSVELPRVAAPAAVLPASPGGAFDAGPRVGHDVAAPAAAPASATPRLNLELARPRGGELSRYSTSGVLPVLPRPPERDDKLAREIEKAGKSDCRSAYSALGPLAVIPLAVDAVRKEGACKW